MAILEIRVVPSSGMQKWEIDEGGRIKCYLKSPPEAGKANKELIALLSSVLGIPQRHIAIVQGFATRHKRVSIPGALDTETFVRLVGFKQPKA